MATPTGSEYWTATARSSTRTIFSGSRLIICWRRADTSWERRAAWRLRTLLDGVAKLYGVQIYESPVGFKYVGPFLRDDKIAIGGEESAGMTIRGHLPEKDGILACLLVAEMIAARQNFPARSASEIYFAECGREYWPVRLNLPLSDEAHKKLVERLKSDPSEFAGKRVVNVNRLDGMKLAFEDGSWVLIRPSGTEPVVRIYTETASVAASQKLAEEARKWITTQAAAK